MSGNAGAFSNARNRRETARDAGHTSGGRGTDDPFTADKATSRDLPDDILLHANFADDRVNGMEFDG